MASLRHHNMTIPAVSERDPVGAKYLDPVLEVFKKYIFCERECTIGCQAWFDVNTGADGVTEVVVWVEKDCDELELPFSPAHVKQAAIHIVFVPPGSVCWYDFTFHEPEPAIFMCSKNSALIKRLQAAKKAFDAEYVILTDELHAAVFDQFEECVDVGWSSVMAHHGPLPPLSEHISLRCIIGAALNNAFKEDYHYTGRVQSPYHMLGALNHIMDHGWEGPSVAINEDPQDFSDFDLYTMQRHLPDLYGFLKWKNNAQNATVSQPLNVDAILDVDVDAFSRQEFLLKFTIPLDKPPQESQDIVMDASRGLRDPDIDEILARADGTLQFKITEVVRSRPDTYSRIFFGQLCWTSGPLARVECQTPVCLKLFDETWFPLPTLAQCAYEHMNSDEHNRLRTVQFATDMMRHEQAVYDRLKYLQGSMLPHAYGFHQFTLPDGRKVYGFLTEVIQGTPLSELSFEQWPLPVQLRTVSRLRHAVRALRYGGVQQGDWHLGQILITKAPPLPYHTMAHDTDVSVVLLDFAFTELRLGSVLGPKVAELFRSYDKLGQELMEPVTFKELQYGDKTWFPDDDLEL
ncbi:hypothetical protein EUX98_g5293 [Antrodiella citrinella]|uniref:Protein kinase domain-containing protein n=1 Tax=Antrodiella citrinella TaxID=2447956 RepID=A0A4S4MUQ1_9APHY|nr:hypothetical protein EUX98_g5293 [Antrodiella citrinella]